MEEVKKKKHYINNQTFLETLIDYKIKCKENDEKGIEAPPIPNYIGECFLKIAEGYSHKPNFINYTYREEMVSDAIENCLRYFHNFDPEISKNPFAYFTQIIHFAFLRRIDKEKKEQYVKYKSAENSGLFDEGHTLDLDNGVQIQFEMYDNLSEFIGNFEESRRKKKEVKKKKGLENFIDS